MLNNISASRLAENRLSASGLETEFWVLLMRFTDSEIDILSGIKPYSVIIPAASLYKICISGRIWPHNISLSVLISEHVCSLRCLIPY